MLINAFNCFSVCLNDRGSIQIYLSKSSNIKILIGGKSLTLKSKKRIISKMYRNYQVEVLIMQNKIAPLECYTI